MRSETQTPSNPTVEENPPTTPEPTVEEPTPETEPSAPEEAGEVPVTPPQTTFVQVNLLHFDRIAQSLETLAEQFVPTTATPPASGTPQPTQIAPVTEVAVQGNDTEITLPDGRTVPTKVIRALAEYDNTTWPGAVTPEARAAIAHVVIKTIESDQEPVLRTNYPFCLNDDPRIREKSSPCIKRADHRGKHQDNNDGVW